MLVKSIFTLLMLTLFLAAVPALAQNDPIGKIDTVTLKIETLSENKWMVTAHLWNDEELAALDIPIRFTAGIARVLIDSISFKDTRISYFAQKYSPVDTLNQVAHFGGLAYLGPDKPPLAPGEGVVARIYFSVKGDTKAGLFTVDTTTVPPNSSLMLVDRNAKIIVPALKIEYMSTGKK